MTWSLQFLQGDEVKEDPDKLKPYKTDLDYLDDHLQVAQCTIPQVSIQVIIPGYIIHPHLTFGV